MERETGDRPAAPKLRIAALVAQPLEIDENPISQVIIRAQSALMVGSGEEILLQLDSGTNVRLLSAPPSVSLDGYALVVPEETLRSVPTTTDLTSGQWIGPRRISTADEVRATLAGTFRFVSEDQATKRLGLRSPQLGAVHSVLGYWTTRKTDPVTVVMPTGTGKTETMLALFCAGEVERLLVVVPSDALRTQISEKFLSFGWLQEFGIVPGECLRPVVGQVKHGFSDASTAEEFARRCNVIVATPDALGASPTDVRSAIFDSCSHLFVDEAHHVAANTWSAIRRAFLGKPVVQFTATPFREDDRRLGGRILFTFPLREAQRLGYFSKIDYISVADFFDTDRAIAQRAVERLRSDLASGYDHLVMARVNRISRADTILPLYRELGPEFQPLLLNSTLPEADRRLAIEALRQRTSRIVVCVDMLGEGFDLPSLKIAAIHDPHKSLGITLQFIGRFSRGAPGLGDATVVVARPEGRFDETLRKLYAEDAEWDLIIRDLSESAIANEEEVSEFEDAFGSLPDEISIRSLLPKMSTVVYRVEEDWNPQAIFDVYSAEDVVTNPIPVNDRDGVAWFVVEHRTAVDWGEANAVEDAVFDLFVLYCDRERGLLYINSSHDSLHEEIARAVCGETASRVTGELIYRVLAKIDRIVPTNLGVLDVRNRNRRFSMFVGTSVEEGLPLAETQTKTKTNLFAWGYEEGNRVSVGASLKGRIWSYRIAKSLKHWVDWCDTIGTKLLDEGFDVAQIMKNFIRPVELQERPELVPLALEWPWELLANVRDRVVIAQGDDTWPIIDADLEIRTFNPAGPIEFRVATPEWSVDYELTIERGTMRFSPVTGDAEVRGARNVTNLRDFLNRSGLQVYFERDAVVTPEAILHQPPRDIAPFDATHLIGLDWSGINLAVESQGKERRPDSIQARMIEQLKSLASWDVVLDDDLSYEIADIVALRVAGRTLYIHFTHCKYISSWKEKDRGKERAVIDDLYAVCGQAMKSARWRRDITALLENLIRRQRQYFNRTKVSGFMVGGERKLLEILDQSKALQPDFTITIAQPGLQQSRASETQLELLAATEVYIREVANGMFEAYCSP